MTHQAFRMVLNVAEILYANPDYVSTSSQIKNKMLAANVKKQELYPVYHFA